MIRSLSPNYKPLSYVHQLENATIFLNHFTFKSFSCRFSSPKVLHKLWHASNGHPCDDSFWQGNSRIFKAWKEISFHLSMYVCLYLFSFFMSAAWIVLQDFSWLFRIRIRKDPEFSFTANQDPDPVKRSGKKLQLEKSTKKN